MTNNRPDKFDCFNFPVGRFIFRCSISSVGGLLVNHHAFGSIAIDHLVIDAQGGEFTILTSGQPPLVAICQRAACGRSTRACLAPSEEHLRWSKPSPKPTAPLTDRSKPHHFDTTRQSWWSLGQSDSVRRRPFLCRFYPPTNNRPHSCLTAQTASLAYSRSVI